MKTTGHTRLAIKHPLYSTWKNIWNRCYLKAGKWYYLYGGRGIQMEPCWADFNTFVTDVGPKPTVMHQLDRIDTDKNYGPDNCRWITPTENTVNSRPRNGRKYKGVYQHKGRPQYFVMITWNSKPLHCGSFKTEKEAALAYNKAMLKYYGSIARLNEVEDE